jgi:hypothetical protein
MVIAMKISVSVISGVLALGVLAGCATRAQEAPPPPPIAMPAPPPSFAPPPPPPGAPFVAPSYGGRSAMRTHQARRAYRGHLRMVAVPAHCVARQKKVFNRYSRKYEVRMVRACR